MAKYRRRSVESKGKCDFAVFMVFDVIVYSRAARARLGSRTAPGVATDLGWRISEA